MRWPAHIGRWEIEGLLGAGGMAEVLGGHGPGPEGTPIDVALKRSLPQHAEALRAEARVLARLHHPHVVGFVEYIDETAHTLVPTLVLERMHGRTLAEILVERTPPLDLSLELGRQAALALSAVHAAVDETGVPLEVVHRDVSPDNLFLTRGGILKLFDFSVARLRGGPPNSGALVGRVAYMAPEQARGEDVDARADVFALGVILWELIEGARLFWRGSTLASLRAVVDEPIPAIAPRHPAALVALVAATLARDPRARPSAVELARALGELVPADPARAARLGALAEVR